MNAIHCKLVGLQKNFIPSVQVDGQYIFFKKNEFGSYEAQIQTEKEEIEFILSRDLELKGKFWLLYAILSFIISIFGIFEPLYDRKCISLHCHFKMKLNQTNEIKIKFNSLQPSKKAVEIETQNECIEQTNEYQVDKLAKKRWIILLLIKLIVWLIIAILLGFFISKTI